MFRKIIALIFSMILVPAAVGIPSINAQSRTDVSPVERVRTQIARRGTGERARLEVRLRDNTRVKGYVSETGQESFTLTDRKTGAQRTIAYTDVARVGDGGGMSSRTQYIILGGAAVAAAVVLYSIRGAFCDGQC